jgi:hypothetical protein
MPRPISTVLSSVQLAMKVVPSVFTLTGCSRVLSFRCSNDPGQLASVAAQIRDEVE